MSIKTSATVAVSPDDIRRGDTALSVVQSTSYASITDAPTIDSLYYDGDAYDKTRGIAQEWEITDMSNFPYLAHVKAMSTAWTHLRYLADFMEVTTTPLRWKVLRQKQDERRERSCRTSVAILDFPDSGRPICQTAENTNELRQLLSDKFPRGSGRLIIVEDLSREVIEILGTKFDIDPDFFRDQISDYSWFNIRDRWMIPPNLKSATKMQNWTRVRFIRPRYFENIDSFEVAQREANLFNVFRRPDNEQNQWEFLDGPAIVAISRTRTLFWLNTDYGNDHETIGIILVDPTVKEGFPLWKGYRNWSPIPSMYSKETRPAGPPRTSLFDDTIHWTMSYPGLSSRMQSNSPKFEQILALPTLNIACGEWKIMCELIKTRLAQVEWELGFPEYFKLSINQGLINLSLRRLHSWRRLIPLYREILADTLNESIPRLSQFMSHSATHSDDTQGASAAQTSSEPFTLRDIISDFEKVSAQMKELQDRTDRIASVLMAAISIEDSRRGLQENRNVSRLTWLATLFIPLTFIAGLFSMQSDIGSLRLTFGWYFAAAIPVTSLALGLAMNIKLFTLPRIKRQSPRGH